MLLIAELDPIIVTGYSEGQERFGNLGLDLQIYAQRVHSIVHKHLGASPQPRTVIEFVKGLHGPDLYLATSCAQNCPGTSNGSLQATASENASVAWKTLEKTYKGFICDLVRFFYSTTFAAQDLADSILADLFLPDRSGSSRIASYDGRSSLSTWLRVVVCNRAINAKRCSAVVKNTDIQAEIPDEPALQNIELTVRAKRYGKALGDSLATACRGLTPRERLILLWRYEDSLQLGQIARLLGIHQSNVTRQLERMQNKLRDEVIAVLSRKHGLSSLAISECIQDIVENPRHGISILDFIKERSAGLSAAPPPTSNQNPLEPGSKAIQSSQADFELFEQHRAIKS
ncbi:MAG TPA: sigma-70 family RNA polymerase sigma factor [Candidatus Angelobacter sp.]